MLPYIETKYLPVLVYVLCVWVYRWLFAPPESRRVLLFVTGCGAVVCFAVLSVEGATWVCFTMIGFWLATVMVMLILNRDEKRREDCTKLLAFVGIFTLALITVVYGVNSYASAKSQNLLGHSVLWIAVLAVILISRFMPRGSPSNPEDLSSKK